MATRTARLLLKRLPDVFGATSGRQVERIKRTNIRGLGSCGALGARRAGLSLHPVAPDTTSTRSFINLVAPISNRRMEYTESRTLGYTPEQMYNVVLNVDQYQHFVPWCKRSRVIKEQNGVLRAELQIGFPPILERYTSDVTFVPNHQVRAVCADGSLFSHLETIWRFTPGAKDTPASCKVEFYVSFEFKSLLHSQLASIFFDEVVKKMVNAFESRAAAVYRNRDATVDLRLQL